MHAFFVQNRTPCLGVPYSHLDKCLALACPAATFGSLLRTRASSPNQPIASNHLNQNGERRFGDYHSALPASAVLLAFSNANNSLSRK